MKAKRITAVSKEHVELVEFELPAAELGAGEIEGKTVASVISPGTEVAGTQGLYSGSKFPVNVGYASVFRVEKCGAEVKEFKPGDLVFCMHNHASFQRVKSAECVKVPDGLDPVIAPFCRLMGISMSTLVTTTARPPAKVIISGLGVVGNLAAQVFQRCGYTVYAVEPNENRRNIAANCGIKNLLPSIPLEDKELKGWVQLVVDCSGHEKAVVDALKIIAVKGEVVLLGVPWTRKTDIYAYEAFHAIFHRYAVLRSGWEWEVPFQPGIKGNSILENFAGALKWLKEESVTVDGIYDTALPKEASRVYDIYIKGHAKHLTTVFDWTKE